LPRFFPALRERLSGGRVGTVTGSGGGIGEKQAMAQQTPRWHSGNGEMAWLSALIGTMDKVSCPELRARVCAPNLLAEAEAHLTRPAIPHGFYGSNFSLRN
jgi:hypothetical protein